MNDLSCCCCWELFCAATGGSSVDARLGVKLDAESARLAPMANFADLAILIAEADEDEMECLKFLINSSLTSNRQ